MGFVQPMMAPLPQGDLNLQELLVTVIPLEAHLSPYPMNVYYNPHNE